MELMEHQKKALKESKGLNRVAYYWDMGLGKTFIGAEKLIQLGKQINLVVCQKSKVQDWIDHFQDNYPGVRVTDLTKTKNQEEFFSWYTAWNGYGGATQTVGIAMYHSY